MSQRRNALQLALFLALLLFLVFAVLFVFESPGSDGVDPVPDEPAGAGVEDPGDEPDTARPPKRVRVAPGATASPPKFDRGAAPAPRSEHYYEVRVGVTLDGAPVAGAEVDVRPSNPAYPLNDERWRWSARTDDSGIAVLDIGKGGWFDIRATSGDAATLPQSLEVPRPEGDVTRLRLAPAIDITGVVFDVDGSRLPGASLSFEMYDDKEEWEIGVVGEADSQGAFLIAGAPREMIGRVVVTVDAEDRSRAVFEYGRAEIASGTRLDLRLMEWLLVGRCVDAHGKPVPRVDVFVREGQRQIANTDADGRFSGRFGRRGNERLILVPPAHAALVSELTVPIEQGVVDVGDIVLTGGEPVSGVIVGADSEPVWGVQVGLVPPGLDQSVTVAVTDVDGAFEFEQVGAGTHTLLLKPLQRSLRSPVATVKHQVVAGQTGLRFLLRPQVPVRLIAKWPPKTAVSPRWSWSVAVEVRTSGAATAIQTVEGRGIPPRDWFGFFVAEPGVYDIHVAIPGFEPLLRRGVRIAGVDTVEVHVEPVPVRRR